VELLLKDRRVDKTIKDEKKKTPIEVSASLGRGACVRWLLLSFNGVAPPDLNMAQEMAKKEHKDLADLIGRFIENPEKTSFEISKEIGLQGRELIIPIFNYFIFHF